MSLNDLAKRPAVSYVFNGDGFEAAVAPGQPVEYAGSAMPGQSVDNYTQRLRQIAEFFEKPHIKFASLVAGRLGKDTEYLLRTGFEHMDTILREMRKIEAFALPVRGVDDAPPTDIETQIIEKIAQRHTTYDQLLEIYTTLNVDSSSHQFYSAVLFSALDQALSDVLRMLGQSETQENRDRQFVRLMDDTAFVGLTAAHVNINQLTAGMYTAKHRLDGLTQVLTAARTRMRRALRVRPSRPSEEASLDMFNVDSI